jgi:hypothetical protein
VLWLFFPASPPHLSLLAIFDFAASAALLFPHPPFLFLVQSFILISFLSFLISSLIISHLISSRRRGCDEGVAMARYLCLSQRELSCHDLFSLGLVTNIVCDEPQEAFTYALSVTVPENDDVKSRQVCPTNPMCIKELIVSLHTPICCTSFFLCTFLRPDWFGL